jgi:trimeric autotransporter adhesin
MVVIPSSVDDISLVSEIPPPTITYNALFNTCATSGSVLTATITNPNGIPTSGIGLPVLYWRINAGAYTPVTATSIGSNQYTFNFGTGVVATDVVSYYIVAQDNAGTPLIGVTPSVGATGLTANPPAAGTPPTTPSSYLIQTPTPFTGTFSVGAAGTYTSLTQAVNAYNTSCLTGPVVFELIDPLYSTNETFPIVINHNADASAVNTLLIKPAAANTPTISGNSSYIIRMLGADYVTIDGSNNGSNSRDLTIANTNTTGIGIVMSINNQSASNSASNNSIKNCNITGNTGQSSLGGIFIGSSAALGGSSEIQNNNLNILNNNITRVAYGIYANGNATSPDQNWTINNNTIGGGSDLEKPFRSIYVLNTQNLSINNNSLLGAVNSGTAFASGITIAGNSFNGTIAKNRITDIKNTASNIFGGFGANGILLASSSISSNLVISNNFISDVAAIGNTFGAGVNFNGYGLIVNQGGGYKIYNNSINLNTNQGGDGIPAAILLPTTFTVSGGVDIRNNIFAINQNAATDGYAIYCGSANSVFSNIDNNNYSSNTSNLGYIGSNRATLSDIVAGFGGNANSTTITPSFTSGSDLHLPLTAANAGLLDKAVVVAGVSDDIDNQARGTAPDIGADEFGSLPPTPATPSQSTVTPTCANGTTLTVTGTPPVNVTWYWQGTNANGTSTVQSTTTDYLVQQNGTYYVRAYDAVLTAWSINSSSITVSNIPLAAAPPTPTVNQSPACFSTEISVPNPIGSIVYYWQGTNPTATSTTSTATTPYTVTSTGTYFVRAYNTVNQCWSNASGIPVVINTYVPEPPIVTPSTINICSGATSAAFTASTASNSTFTVGSGMINLSVPDNDINGVSNTLTVTGIPNGASITSIDVRVNATHPYVSDMTISLQGPNNSTIDLFTERGGSGDNLVNTVFSSTATNPIGAGTAPFTGTFLPEGTFSNLFSQANGNWVLSIIDPYSGDQGVLQNWSIAITYTIPSSTVTWYNAATNGTVQGTGTPFETVGSGLLPNTNNVGDYTFYAQAESGGCVNASRTPAVVSIAGLVVDIDPIDVTCNGLANGSFTLTNVSCGVQPFEYSINNGSFSSTIPTNLTEGTYTIVVRDASTPTPLQSAPFIIAVNQPTTTIGNPIAGSTPTACIGDLTAIVTATSNLNASTTYSMMVNALTNYTLATSGNTLVTLNVNLPLNATVTATQLEFNNVNSIGSFLGATWTDDVEATLSGALNMPATMIASLGNVANATFTLNTPLISNTGGNVDLYLEDTFGGDGISFGSVNFVVFYNLPNAATLTWWDASTNGTQIGTSSPFDAVGTSVLPNTNTSGTYTLFAQGEFGGCNSVNRTPVTIVVNPLPTVSVTASSSVVCSGSSATLTASGSATSYTWSPAGGNASSSNCDSNRANHLYFSWRSFRLYCNCCNNYQC